MNKIYKSQYNESLGTWVAVPEIAKGRGTSASVAKDILTSPSLPKFAVSALTLALLQVVSVSAYAAEFNSGIVYGGTEWKACNPGENKFSCGTGVSLFVDPSNPGVALGSSVYANMSTAVGNNIEIGKKGSLNAYNNAYKEAEKQLKDANLPVNERNINSRLEVLIKDPKYDISSGNVGKNSVAFGKNISIQTSNTVVVGNDISNTKENSVFLGNNSGYVSNSTHSLGNDSSAVLDKVRLDNLKSIPDYAGPTNVAGVVSVASGNKTRRIQGVAPGLVSDNSADAINGAQLQSTYNYVDNKITDVNTRIDNTNNKINDVDNKYDQKVKKIYQEGWNIAGSNSAGQTVSEKIKFDDQVEFVGTGAAKVTVDQVSGGAKVNVNVDDKAIIHDALAQAPVVYTNDKGDLLKKANNGKWYVVAQVDAKGNPTATATEVAPNDIVASMNYPRTGTTNATNAGTSFRLSNVADGKKPTDAINVRQFEQAVKYDGADHALVTLNGPKATATSQTDKNGVTKITTTDGTKITNVASAGDISDVANASNAVNAADLYNTAQDLKYSIDHKALAFNGDDNQSVTILLDGTLNLKGGADTKELSDGNIGVVRNDNKTLDIKLSKNITGLTSIKLGDVSISTGGINAGGKKITNVEKGVDDKDAVNKGQLDDAFDRTVKYAYLIDSVTNKPKKDTDGKPMIDYDLVSLGSEKAGAQKATVNVIKDQNGKVTNIATTGGTRITNLASAGDINNPDNATNAVNAADLFQATKDLKADVSKNVLSFKGDDNQSVSIPLNKTLALQGGANTTELSDGNIGVIQGSGDTLNIKLNKNITGLTSIKLGDVSISTGGINAGGKKITNVAKGVDDKDAVNKGQLDDAFDRTVKYAFMSDGKTINYNLVSLGSEKVGAQKATVDVTRDQNGKVTNITTTGGTRITNLASAGEIDDPKNATNAVNAADLFQATKDLKAQVDGDLSKYYLSFNGDDDQAIRIPLNKQLNLNGGAAKGSLSQSGNIGIIKAADNTLDVRLNKTITGIDQIYFGDTNTGVSIGTGGLNNGGNKIINVAAGTEKTDAVNKGQLDDLDKKVDDQFDRTVKYVLNKDGSINYHEVALGQDQKGTGTDKTPIKPNITTVVDAKTNEVTKVMVDGGTKITNVASGLGNGQVKDIADVTKDNASNAVNVADLFNVANDLKKKIESDVNNKIDGKFLAFEDDLGQAVKVNLDGTLALKGGAKGELSKGNIGVVSDPNGGGNQLNVQLSKNIKDIETITFDEAKDPTDSTVVSIGKDGLNNGGKKIINVAAGEAETDAVNVKQLEDAITTVKNSSYQGWNLAVNGKNGEKIASKSTVNLTNSDKNIVISTNPLSNNQKDVTFDLAKDINVNSVTTGAVQLKKDGLFVGDPKDSGTIKVTDAGIHAGNKPITGVADGQVAPASKQAINGGQLHAQGEAIKNIIGGPIAYDPAGGNNQFSVDSSSRGIGDTGQDTVHDAIKWIKDQKGTVYVAGHNIEIKDHETEAGTKVISTGDNVTFKSVTITGPNKPNSGVTINGDGIDSGDMKIRNVAPGRVAPLSKDAVNGSQLYQVRQEVNDIDQRAKSGIASAMASAGLPQAYLPGKSMFGAAASTYRGEAAIAVGLSTISDNGKWIVKADANANRQDFGVALGVGYQW